MEQILQYGLQGVVAYGMVGALALILKKKKITLSSDVKLYMLIAIAFAVGFIPADLGNMLFNHLKSAITVAFSLNALNTVANKMGGE